VKLKRIEVDKKPKDCIECPLTKPYTRDCGQTKTVTEISGKTYTKKPDERCKLREATWE